MLRRGGRRRRACAWSLSEILEGESRSTVRERESFGGGAGDRWGAAMPVARGGVATEVAATLGTRGRKNFEGEERGRSAGEREAAREGLRWVGWQRWRWTVTVGRWLRAVAAGWRREE